MIKRSKGQNLVSDYRELPVYRGVGFIEVPLYSKLAGINTMLFSHNIFRITKVGLYRISTIYQPADISGLKYSLTEDCPQYYRGKLGKSTLKLPVFSIKIFKNSIKKRLFPTCYDRNTIWAVFDKLKLKCANIFIYI